MAYSKKIIILLFIFVILFSNICFAVETVNPVEDSTLNDKNISIQHDNQYNTLYMLQYSVQSRLISRIYSQMNDNYWQYHAVAEKIYSEFKTLGEHKKFLYVTEGTDGYYFDIFFGYGQDMPMDVRAIMSASNSQAFTSVPCYVGTIYRVCQIQSAGIYYPDSAVDTIVPLAQANVIHPEWVNLFKAFNLIPSDDTDNSIKNIEKATEDTKNTVNNIHNSVNDVNNSINDDNVNVDSSTLPGDNTTDITADGFNSLFDKIYTTFTSGTAQDVVIKIPFTEKSFTINAANVYGGADLGIVKTLIQTFWYFVISYFIVQDIAKKINKIKSGDIEHVQEDNIKEDLL